MTDLNELTGKVIGAAIEAHKGISVSPPEGLCLLPDSEISIGIGQIEEYPLCALRASSEAGGE